MTASTKRLFAYGFNEMKMHRIEAYISDKNTKCRKTIERCGMTIEGMKKEFEKFPDGYHDMLVYVILKHEFVKLNQ